jgi:hypothetical protein
MGSLTESSNVRSHGCTPARETSDGFVRRALFKDGAFRFNFSCWSWRRRLKSGDSPARCRTSGSAPGAPPILEDRIGRVWNNGVAVYITTSNEQLAGALIADAQSKGFSENRIFVEPIGTNILTGSSASADDMLTLIRYALPQHEGASALWLSKVAENVLVFRVSAPTTQVTRFPTPAYSKKVGISEANYQDSLTELAGLLRSWLAAAPQPPIRQVTKNHLNMTPTPGPGRIGY